MKQRKKFSDAQPDQNQVVNYQIPGSEPRTGRMLDGTIFDSCTELAVTDDRLKWWELDLQSGEGIAPLPAR